VDGCRHIGQNGLDIAFDGILPLLVRCGNFVSTLMFLVELVGFARAESCVVIAAEYPWFESAGGEEAKYAVEVVEKGFFFPGLYGVAEQVFTSVSECNELPVTFDNLRLYRTDVVVADTLADGPLVVLAVVRDACRSKVFGVSRR
jgi:hypothetical protein